MYALFANIQKSKKDELIFQAEIHGAKIKDTNNHSDADSGNKNVPFFSDPKEYKDLSEGEKEKMTEKMQNKHKNWVNGGFLK